MKFILYQLERKLFSTMNIIKIWISSSFLLRLKQNKAIAGKTFVKSDKCNEKNILLGMT